MSQPPLLRAASLEQNTIFIFNRQPIKVIGGISAFFLPLRCLHHAYLPHYFGKIMLGF